MIDQYAIWRNNRWYFDADQCEEAEAPILAALIKQYGYIFDDTYKYILQGKTKKMIIRFPHYGGVRDDPRTDTERPKRHNSHKQFTFKKKMNRETKTAEIILVAPKGHGLLVSNQPQRTENGVGTK